MSKGKQRSKDVEDQLLIEYSATQLRQLQRVCKTFPETEEHLSGKVSLLVDILKQYQEQEGM